MEEVQEGQGGNGLTDVAAYSLSICSGVGMLDLAVDLACPGQFVPVAYVEIEAFAASILATRMAAGFLAAAPVWSNLRTVCDDEFGQYVGRRNKRPRN